MPISTEEANITPSHRDLNFSSLSDAYTETQRQGRHKGQTQKAHWDCDRQIRLLPQQNAIALTTCASSLRPVFAS